MAKISILIPVYNVELYLEECLNSVIHQTEKDLEIICVDDASTPGDSRRPLYALIAAGVINTGLNLILVIAFHLGVSGVLSLPWFRIL